MFCHKKCNLIFLTSLIILLSTNPTGLITVLKTITS